MESAGHKGRLERTSAWNGQEIYVKKCRISGRERAVKLEQKWTNAASQGKREEEEEEEEGEEEEGEGEEGEGEEDEDEPDHDDDDCDDDDDDDDDDDGACD